MFANVDDFMYPLYVFVTAESFYDLQCRNRMRNVRLEGNLRHFRDTQPTTEEASSFSQSSLLSVYNIATSDGFSSRLEFGKYARKFQVLTRRFYHLITFCFYGNLNKYRLCCTYLYRVGIICINESFAIKEDNVLMNVFRCIQSLVLFR